MAMGNALAFTWKIIYKSGIFQQTIFDYKRGIPKIL